MSDPTTHSEEQDEQLGVVHENLQGWIPSLASAEEVRVALEKAFDYRGDLTMTLKNGEKIDGYVFDRRANSSKLNECFVRVMPKDRPEKLSIPYSEIAALAFSGKDTAAGKSFEAWVKKYQAKKAAGEKNIGIDSELIE
jgi:hypothetical protein